MDSSQQKNEPDFFKPQGRTMRNEVRIIKIVLAGWLGAVVTFQLIAWYIDSAGSGSILGGLNLFNLPLKFWLSGQLLPLWFVILCFVFNVWMDRHSAPAADGSLRFRVKSSAGEDA